MLLRCYFGGPRIPEIQTNLGWLQAWVALGAPMAFNPFITQYWCLACMDRGSLLPFLEVAWKGIGGWLRLPMITAPTLDKLKCSLHPEPKEPEHWNLRVVYIGKQLPWFGISMYVYMQHLFCKLISYIRTICNMCIRQKNIKQIYQIYQPTCLNIYKLDPYKSRCYLEPTPR